MNSPTNYGDDDDGGSGGNVDEDNKPERFSYYLTLNTFFDRFSDKAIVPMDIQFLGNNQCEICLISPNMNTVYHRRYERHGNKRHKHANNICACVRDDNVFGSFPSSALVVLRGKDKLAEFRRLWQTNPLSKYKPLPPCMIFPCRFPNNIGSRTPVNKEMRTIINVKIMCQYYGIYYNMIKQCY